MGIRFRCHRCGHELHVKDFQAGKRSKCPECETKFRIPNQSAERSIPLDNPQENSQENSQANSQNSSLSDDPVAMSSSGATIGTATETLAAPSTSIPLAISIPLASNLPSLLRSEPQVDVPIDGPQEIDRAASQLPVPLAVRPKAILESPEATWYVRPPAGGQYGPAPADIFCEWLTENRVTRDSLVWRDGWPQWLVASDVFTDYFGQVLPQVSAATFPPSFAPAVAPLAQMAAPEFVAPTSLSDRTLAARKRQRKKNYMIMIGILTAISVGLVIALVAVLMRNL